MNWWMFAILSAVFAAATAILAKIGIQNVPSNLGTAIRTVVIVVFAWAVAGITGELKALPNVSTRSYVFLGLSAVTTALSWLAYFRALQLGPASRVAPVDKLSVALTVVLAWVLLREPFTPKVGVGVVLIVAGVILCIR